MEEGIHPTPTSSGTVMPPPEWLWGCSTSTRKSKSSVGESYCSGSASIPVIRTHRIDTPSSAGEIPSPVPTPYCMEVKAVWGHGTWSSHCIEEEKRDLLVCTVSTERAI